MNPRLQIATEKISAIRDLAGCRIESLNVADAGDGDPVTVGNCLKFQCEPIEVRFNLAWWMDCIFRELDNLHDFSFVVSVEPPAHTQARTGIPMPDYFYWRAGNSMIIIL